MANDVFIDVHAHSSVKYVYDKNDLWKSIGKPNITADISGTYTYTSSDFSRMAEGRVQVAFIPLHPIEQRATVVKDNFPKIAEKAILLLASYIAKVSRPVLDSMKTIKYNHYRHIVTERKFLEATSGRVRMIRFKNGRKQKCRYKIVKNAAEVQTILRQNRQRRSLFTIAVVLTVEGGHALGSGHLNFKYDKKIHKDSNVRLNASEKLLLRRVNYLKGIGTKPNVWHVSPLWITLAHAFKNDHFGHSQALIPLFTKTLKYAEQYRARPIPGFAGGRNKAMDSTAKKIIKRLLGIDGIRIGQGQRILIDIKHLSTKSRVQYYDILDAHHKTHPQDNIPILISHGAVNGKASVYSDPDPHDEQKDWKKSRTFNPWSFGLYNDEIIKIHNSKGLIGLIADQRVLAGGKRVKGSKLWIHRRKKRWVELITDQILHIVRTVSRARGVNSPHDAWKLITIGSDFDGGINPIDTFDTALKFSDLKKSLITQLWDKRFNPYRKRSEIKKLVDGICSKNALAFLKANY